MIAFLTLVKRESVRFIKDTFDTILPPTVSAILYILIFGVALGTRMGVVNELEYIQFIMPGLILLAIIQNSFLNPAYSLFQSRWDGNIADFLVTPMSNTQIALAIILGGVIRGMIIGTLVAIFGILLSGLPLWNFPLMFGFALVVSLTFASLGCIVGLWSKGWEGVGAVSTFVLDPLVLLGGVFYSLEMVQGVTVIGTLTQINPFTYIMETFRYTIFGFSEIPALTGLLIILALCTILLSVVFYLFGIGYNLKK